MFIEYQSLKLPSLLLGMRLQQPVHIYSQEALDWSLVLFKPIQPESDNLEVNER